MKILVFGANGLVGSNLVNSLVDAEVEVRAFDRFSRNPSFVESPFVEIYAGDFHSVASVKNALIGVTHVVIATGASSPAASENDPLLDIEHTLMPTIRVVQLCAEAKIEGLYFCSSGGAIYGELERNQHSSLESDGALPISPYGISKLAIENYLRYFATKYGLSSVIFRISNVFGSPVRFVRGQGLIPAILLNAMRNQTVLKMGDGTSLRDYIFAKDLARMMTTIILGKPKFGIYNLGTGIGRDVNSVIEIIGAVTNMQITTQEVAAPKTFLSRQVLNMERYILEFGNIPETPFEEAIDEMWKKLISQDLK